MNCGGTTLLPTPGRSAHALGMLGEQGQMVPVEGCTAKGWSTNTGQGCKLSPGLPVSPQ